VKPIDIDDTLDAAKAGLVQEDRQRIRGVLLDVTKRWMDDRAELMRIQADAAMMVRALTTIGAGGSPFAREALVGLTSQCLKAEAAVVRPPRPPPCEQCRGMGWRPHWSIEVCAMCSGSGRKVAPA